MLRTYFATLLLGAVATLMVSSLPAAPVIEEPLSRSEEGKANTQRYVLYPKECDLALPGSCSIAFSARREGDDFSFNMWTNYTSYVSVAFGETQLMGNDSVIECVKEGELVKAYMSFNSGKTETKHGGNQRLPTEEQKGIKLLSFSTANGILSCSVQRDQKTTVQKKEYDLATGSWYLQVAAGDRLKEGNVGIAHHNRWAVSEKVMITKDGLTLIKAPENENNGPNSATTSSVNVVLLLALIGVSGMMYS